MRFLPGSVTLVGGGPGDPDLVTVGALRALRAADVVLYDRLAPLECLAECRDDCERVDVGKVPRGAFTPQERINQMLIEHARAGRVVVRFKGGDPFVFGRGGEEWQACAEAGVPVQVLPGVSSSISVPALAAIPVTHRGLTQGFSVVSGHVPPGDPRSSLDWAALARTHATLVVLMGVKNLPAISAALLEGGLDAGTPATVIADAGTPRMRIVHATLATVAEAATREGIRPPAITVIGSVAAPGLLG
ncbi:hypothetical protein GCM10009785_12750 [Brooklawnia cerclae]